MTTAQSDRQYSKQRVVECVRGGGTLAAAARAAGVSVSTVARWRRADAVFDRQIKQARSGPTEAPVYGISTLEALRRIDDIVQQAEEAGELDVDTSDMDGPFAS